MMECTSPTLTVRFTPRRISLPLIVACKFLISSRLISLSDAPLKADAEYFLRFPGELHGQLAAHRFSEAVDDHGNSFFLRHSALRHVKNLGLTKFRSRTL